MSKILQAQIERLSSKYPCTTNGNTITVHRYSDMPVIKEIKVIFEDYFITGFPGFDFHEKFNNNIPPFDKVMYGKIIKETDRMYYFDLHTETSDKQWMGWCPNKSCTIK